MYEIMASLDLSKCDLECSRSYWMEHDETGCQPPPEGPILCVNNCGFFGSAANMNMCSKCYKDLILKQEQAKVAKTKVGPNRCGTCKKQVGLTGFKCRCGYLFCGSHRYSDKHECPFDYRSATQDVIAKANPVVRAEKLDKIWRWRWKYYMLALLIIPR